ncbi:transcriptional regulator [Methanocella conradii]|uniref:transcriptional regulator n=1 Tax=Methanocella conradii TaxID=1175444 RepID=UPI00157D4FAD|nr:transcriptional regulator [Methanocella conradii]
MELKKLMENRLLGNPIRLAIMLYLLTRRRVLFKDLQNVLEITPGNLDSHLKSLEEYNYIKRGKILADRPRTAIEITENGVQELVRYMEMLKETLGMSAKI